MIITAGVINVADQLVRDPAKNAELNNWLLEEESILVEWALGYASAQTSAIMSDGPMPIQPGMMNDIRSAITSAVSVGFAIATVGNNAQYSEGVSGDILKSSIKGNVGMIYDRWIKGLMDSKYYDATNPDLLNAGIYSQLLHHLLRCLLKLMTPGTSRA